jgi:hypothetical protein
MIRVTLKGGGGGGGGRKRRRRRRRKEKWRSHWKATIDMLPL